MKHINELMDEYNIESNINFNEDVKPVSTGYQSIDNLLNGGIRSGLTIIAAQNHMGDLHFLGNLALNISKTNRVLYNSYWLSVRDLIKNFVSCNSRISIDEYYRKNLHPNQKENFSREFKRIRERELYLNHSVPLEIDSLILNIRKNVIKHDIKIVLLDSLDLPYIPKLENLGDERLLVSKRLKLLSEELEVPIIVLTKMVQQHAKIPLTDEMPELKDIMGVDTFADNVMFLYRPEVFGFEECTLGLSTKNQLQVGIAKNSSGRTGIIHLNYEKKIARIT